MKDNVIQIKKVSFFVILIAILILPVMISAQDALNDYRTKDSGTNNDWTTVDNWEVCTVAGDPGFWDDAGVYPGANSNVNLVTIMNNRSIVLDTDLTTYPIVGLIIESGNSLDLNGYNFETEDSTIVDGTLTLGSGSHTFIGGMSITGTAIFNANSSNITLAGDLIIASGATWSDESTNTATFSFPEFRAYTVSISGGRSFDKIEHNTTNTEGARTLTFTGGTATIRTSYTRSGRSQGTDGTISYAPGASLIYAPSGVTMTVDTEEWPSYTVPNLVLQSGTISFPSGTYTIDNKLTRVNGTVSGTGTIKFNPANETTLEYAPSPAASVTVGSEWPPLNVPSNVTINNSGNTVTASGTDRNIPGTLTMTAGTLAMGTNNLTVLGTISGSDIADGGIVTSSGIGKITMGNGSGTENQYNQTITGSVTLSNLTINKADTDGSNTVTISGSPTISNGFTVTNGNVVINSSGGLTISSGSLTLNNASTFTNNHSVTISSGSLIANNTSVFEMTPGSSISVGTLDLNNTATYKTGGNTITGLSTLTTDAGTTFEFNGTTTETTPSGASFGNLNMNNLGGLDISGSVTVNGTLTFSQDATINTGGSNILTLSTTAPAVAGSSSDSWYVNGPLRKQLTVTDLQQPYVFPVGTTAKRSATFEWVTGNFGGTSVIEITHGSSFTPKSPPPSGISTIDASTHYVVQDVGTPPSSFTYNFTGTFEEGNFTPETRNRAMPETDDSTYTVAGTNYVAPDNNTVQSGTFIALPEGNMRFVFGAETLEGEVTWIGGSGNSWFTDTNWDPGLPGTSSYVSIEGNVTVNIDGSGAAVCSTLTIGDGSNLAILNITSSNENPLTIHETTGMPLSVESNSYLVINTSNSIKFDPDGTNSYDAARTNFKSGSTVEYQSLAGANVQVDNYGNLVINDASETTGGSGTIAVSGSLTKQGDSNTFTSNNTIYVTGSYTHTEGTATYSGGSGLTVNGAQFNLNGGTAGGTIAINSPTINVNGGSFAGTVTFSGSSAQSLVPVTAAASFNNLIMNKSANNLTINGSNGASVTGTLTLTQGLINTASGLLTLSSGTTGSLSSYIDGPLAITGTDSKEFPIGKNGLYGPVIATGTSGTTQFELFTGDPGGEPGDLEVISSVRYWQGSGNIDGTVTFMYYGYDGVAEPEDLRVAQSSTADGTYDSAGGVGIDGSITSTTITSLGFFTFGSLTGDNPLPVELASFEALADYSKIELTWITASESNNLGFNIYKTTAREDAWNKVNSNLIEGQGTVSYASDYSFVDSKIIGGETYRYKLESVSVNGLAIEEKIVEVTVPIPDQYALFNNYPNPFNPTTNIKFQLPEAQQIRLNVYDLNGSLIRTLANDKIYPSGEHIVSWDATDKAGNRVASGIYLYRFQAGKFVKTGKMVLVK